MTITTVALSTDRADRSGSVGGRTDGYYAAEINALHLVVNRITAFMSGIDSSVGFAEFVRDTIGATIVAGANVTVTVNDVANTITIASTGGGSGDPEFIRDTIAATLLSGTGVVVTANDSADTITVSADPEYIRDTIGATLVAGANVSLSVNDASDTITINASTAPQAAIIDAEVITDTVLGAVRPGAGVDLVTDDSASTLTLSSSTFGYAKQSAAGAWPSRPARPWVVWERTGSSTVDPSAALAGDLVIEARSVTSPSIVTQPVPQSIATGDRVTLSVVASGSTPLTYQWYVGSSGTTTSPISGATGPAYATPALTSTTAYWVRVTNAAGSIDSNTAAVTIGAAPPVITAQPGSTAIASGQTASLSVTATGATSYQWYVGATGTTTSPISGATLSTFTTPALTATTTYWVRVTNAAGSTDSNSATVTVTAAGVAPTITSNPQSPSISSGGAATLSVTATGTAPLTYQWYAGASGSTGSPISGATSASYTTPALSSTASYWCRVTNQFGSADSITATVTITAGVVLAVADSESALASGDGLASGTAWFPASSTTDPLLGISATVGGSAATVTALSVAAFKADGVTAVEPGAAGIFVTSSASPWTVRVVNGTYAGVFLLRITATVNSQQVSIDRWINLSAFSPTYTATRLSNGSAIAQVGATTASAYQANNDTVVITASHSRWGAATAVAYVADILGASPSGRYSQVGSALRVNTLHTSTVSVQFRVALTFTTTYGSITIRDDRVNGSPQTRRAVRFEAAIATATLSLANFDNTPFGAGTSSGSPYGIGFDNYNFALAASVAGTIVVTSIAATFNSVTSTVSTSGTTTTVSHLGSQYMTYNTAISGRPFSLGFDTVSGQAVITINATVNGVAATPLTFYAGLAQAS